MQMPDTSVRSREFSQPQYEIPTQFRAEGPTYITSPLEIHVNVSDGVFEKRAYGIFVTSINFKASSKDLREYFSRAGRITECRLQRDASAGRVKGNATLQYALPENVRKAAEMFDGEPFMGRRLRVRIDRVFAASNPPPIVSSQTYLGASDGNTPKQNVDRDGPVVVDGSKSGSQSGL
jgi:RNA recognition motif-containing protein